MGFNFDNIGKKKPSIKIIDNLQQYIKNEFDILTNNYNTKYTIFDSGNFDYKLSFLYDMDDANVPLGMFNISMKDIIDNDKYLYTIIPIKHINSFLNITPTLKAIVGDPSYIEQTILIKEKINDIINKKTYKATYYNTNNIEKTGYHEYYDNIIEKTDPFSHLHEYSHCIFFNNLIADQPTDLIYTDSLIIKSLSKAKIYNTTHIIIAGYFDRHSFEEIKHILPFHFSHEVRISDLNLVVIGVLVFELPYMRDEEMYKEQLQIQKEWEKTIKNYTVNIKEPTRYYDTDEPGCYDLTPAGITLYDPKKIYTMNI